MKTYSEKSFVHSRIQQPPVTAPESKRTAPMFLWNMPRPGHRRSCKKCDGSNDESPTASGSAIAMPTGQSAATSVHNPGGISSSSTEFGGGVAWPYPVLSIRHWSAPKSVPINLKKPAQPAGVGAKASVGMVKTFVAGAGRSRVGRPTAKGIINPTDEELLFILLEAIA